jgi:phosphate-selective porin OprO and OprP
VAPSSLSRTMLLLLGLAAPALARAQSAPPADGLAWRNDRPVLTLGNGAVSLSPIVRLDADEVTFFDQNRAGGFRSGTELRRNRLGLRGTLLRDFEFNFIWEFGSRPSTANTIYEADIAYTGLGWGTVRLGYFTPQHLPEYAGSSFDLLFLERAAITNVVASLASGDTRAGFGLEAHGDRWNASAYGTGGVGSTRNSSKQRGLVGRAVGLVWDQPGAQLQLGVDAAAQFTPGLRNTPDGIRLSDYPELRGTTALRFLDTATIPAERAAAFGPELSARAGPVYIEALYQHVMVDATGGGTRNFDGWYAQAAVPLLGPPRERSRQTGTWQRPKTEGWIDPTAGRWGAIEATARISVADLRDGPTRGGRQRIWTLGVNWFLSPNLRLMANWETGTVRRDDGTREFQGVGLRASLNL